MCHWVLWLCVLISIWFRFPPGQHKNKNSTADILGHWCYWMPSERQCRLLWGFLHSQVDTITVSKEEGRKNEIQFEEEKKIFLSSSVIFYFYSSSHQNLWCFSPTKAAGLVLSRNNNRHCLHETPMGMPWIYHSSNHSPECIYMWF